MHDDLKTALDKDRFNEPRVIYPYKEKEFDEDFDGEKMPKAGRAARNAAKNEDKKDKKMNKALIIVGAITATLVSLLLFFILILPKITDKKDVIIPDVSGMSVTQAESTLKDKGFEVAAKTKKENSDDVEKDKVIGTDPEVGRSMKAGTKVTLIVSKGTEKIKIEDYTGKNYYEVKAKLEAAKITVVLDKKDVSDSEKLDSNTILSQDVKVGEKLGKGDTITLTIPNIYKNHVC